MQRKIRKLFHRHNLSELALSYPIFSYKNTLELSGFVVYQLHTDGVLPIVSDRMERCLHGFTEQLVRTDRNLSKILKGFGANYYCIAQKKTM